MQQELVSSEDTSLRGFLAGARTFRLRSWLQSLDWKVILVLLSAAGLLTVQEYGFGQGDGRNLVRWCRAILPQSWGASLAAAAEAPENQQLAALLNWALGQCAIYVVVPLLLIKFVFREKAADYGCKLKGMFGWLPVYAIFFLIMLPAIYIASTTDSFALKYPFYRLRTGEPLWPRFIVWEIAYALQFVALEFFFRGFLVHGLKHRFGAYSVFVMTVPYCMIHFGKPWAETTGAIGAGVILGLLSLRTRSIWLGAVLHIAVAWSMDLFALW